jgi:antitoxin component YwqK of YwqJK toxin-antitoxin module
MNKILLILLLIPIFGFSQIELKPANRPRGEKHKNIMDEMKRKQGLWKYFNSNRELIKEIEYVNNLKEGSCKTYYMGGKNVKEEMEYLGGMLEGPYVKYFFGGETAIEGTYVNNKKSDAWKWNYESGETKFEGNYKNGKKDGQWKYYNRKGEVIKTVTYNNGIPITSEVTEPNKKQQKVNKPGAKTKAVPATKTNPDKVTPEPKDSTQQKANNPE